MKDTTIGRLTIGLLVGFVGSFLWATVGDAQPFPGGIPACQMDLQTCDTDLETCETELNECVTTPSFPGDGYMNPGPNGLSGHGLALSYMDHGDLTVTDLTTKYMWEVKLSSTGDDGGDCDEALQEDRSVHCINNVYKYSNANFGPPNGSLFMEFLWALNNTCSEDALLPFSELTECEDDNECDESCGFAGHRNWKIPNVKKLHSLVDYSELGPAISSTFPGGAPFTIPPGPTLTITPTTSNNLWTIAFLGGALFVQGTDDDGSARAVRNP